MLLDGRPRRGAREQLREDAFIPVARREHERGGPGGVRGPQDLVREVRRLLQDQAHGGEAAAARGGVQGGPAALLAGQPRVLGEARLAARSQERRALAQHCASGSDGPVVQRRVKRRGRSANGHALRYGGDADGRSAVNRRGEGTQTANCESFELLKV